MAPQQQQQQQQQPEMKIDLSTLQSAEIAQAKPGPQSPQLEKDAKRAMSHTADWQPSLVGRREGYRQEDHRREVMMSSSSSSVGGGAGAQGMGFSEGSGPSS
ncbi:hypothetical protein E0Z10_g6160 [Xylaria hypoxylon]|uniref:Uncharacterized protein n=1 Tax=Xylaria hypoxylon TaxID=37992 RepID=A0A4Z0YEF4_9PEZI|nr:hypothetical protein E0Z10_g6160 [Xylaria hypoxylon]